MRLRVCPHPSWLGLLLVLVLGGCGGGGGGGSGAGDDGGDTGAVVVAGQDTVLDETAYYVSVAGDDEADGTSEDTPYASLARALAAVRPKGTVFILPGVYTESIQLEGRGLPEAPITIRGWGGVPVFDGGGKKTLGIFCEACTNIVFQDLEVRNYTDIGIGGTLSTGLTFRNLKVHHNGAAVQLVEWELEGYGIHVDESSDVLIEGNDVYENGPDPPVFPDRLLGTGIDTFALTDSRIRNNRSYRNHGGGILVEDGVNILVEGNEVYENDLDATADEWWDGGLWLDGGRGVTVRGNTFRDNLGPGIEISDEDLQHPTGYVLQDNVSTGNYFGVYLWNFGTTGWPDAAILERSGNQFTGNTRQDVWIADWD